MASRYYAASVGAMNPTDVTEGSSSGSLAVELVIDLAKTTSIMEVLQALEAIKNYLITKETNPIA